MQKRLQQPAEVRDSRISHKVHRTFVPSQSAKRVCARRIGCSANSVGHCSMSAGSFDILHSANARAFNILKSLAGANPPRKPALLLYEGTNALSDLESTEQYRIFARHVLTSERMWGGMLTCFVEPTIGTAEAELLRIYSDLILRLPEVQSGQSV